MEYRSVRREWKQACRQGKMKSSGTRGTARGQFRQPVGVRPNFGLIHKEFAIEFGETEAVLNFYK
jgi:hypothetical protein